MDAEINGSKQTFTGRQFDKNIWCSIIAALQILGGISIFGLFFYEHGFNPPNYWLALILTPAAWGVYAGSLLWMGRLKGLKYSAIVNPVNHYYHHHVGTYCAGQP